MGGGIITRVAADIEWLIAPQTHGYVFGPPLCAPPMGPWKSAALTCDVWSPVARALSVYGSSSIPTPVPSHIFFVKQNLLSPGCVFDSYTLADYGFRDRVDFRYPVYLVFTGQLARVQMDVFRDGYKQVGMFWCPRASVVQLHGPEFWTPRGEFSPLNFRMKKARTKDQHEFSMMVCCTMRETGSTSTVRESPPRRRRKHQQPPKDGSGGGGSGCDDLSNLLNRSCSFEDLVEAAALPTATS